MDSPTEVVILLNDQMVSELSVIRLAERIMKQRNWLCFPNFQHLPGQLRWIMALPLIYTGKIKKGDDIEYHTGKIATNQA